MTAFLLRISLVICLLMTVSTPAAAIEVPLPYLVKDTIAGSEPAIDSWGVRPYPLIPGSAALYYFPQDTSTRVWSSGGTPSGTHQVGTTAICFKASEWPGENRPVEWATVVGNVLYYSGSDCHLWRTDGTEAGTWRVKYLNASPAIYGNPQNFARLNNSIVFTAWGWDQSTNKTPYRLWVSDGTPEGTLAIKDLNPDLDLAISPLRVVGNLAYFFTNPTYSIAGGTWHRLWRTDGTANGTFVIAEFTQAYNVWKPAPVVGANGLAFFSAPKTNNNASEVVLWQTDGSSAGTQVVDATNGPVGSYEYRYRLVAANNGLYVMHHTDTGVRIYHTQGKAQGGVALVTEKTLNSAWGGSDLPAAAAVDERLFFARDWEIWETDGTSENTRQVATLEGNVTLPSNFFAAAGHLYFAAKDAAHGTELWSTDTQSGETGLVMDINPGAESAQPGHFAWLNGRLFFYAYEPAHGQELWVISFLTEKVFLPGVGR